MAKSLSKSLPQKGFCLFIRVILQLVLLFGFVFSCAIILFPFNLLRHQQKQDLGKQTYHNKQY